MVPFPNSSKKLQQNKPSYLEIEIFCICRMPEFRKKHGFYNSREIEFVQCSGCLKWYHPKCKKIAKKYIDTNLNYYCSRPCHKK